MKAPLLRFIVYNMDEWKIIHWSNEPQVRITKLLIIYMPYKFVISIL